MSASHDKYYDPYQWDDNEDSDVAVLKNKRKIRDRNSKLSKSSAPSEALGLILHGRACNIHRNDVLAQSLQEEKHLINYWENRLAIDLTNKIHTKHCNVDGEEEDTWCDIVHIDGSDFDTLPHDQNSVTETCRTNTLQSMKSAPQQLLLDRYDARNLLDEYHTINHTINNNDSLTKLQMYLKDQRNERNPQDQEMELNLERYGCLKEYVHTFCCSTKDTEDSKGTQVIGLCLERNNKGAIIEELKGSKTADENSTSAEESEFEMEEHENFFLPIGMVVVRILKVKTLLIVCGY